MVMTDHDTVSVQDKLPSAIDAVSTFLDDGWKVYLHCTSGVNRAPTAAIGYLATQGEVSLDEAIEHVTDLRRCLPFIDVIGAYLANDVE